MHNKRDENGDTLLHTRLRNCDISVIEIKQCIRDGANVNIRNSQRRTLLLEAAKFSNLGTEVFKLLLMWSASVSDCDSEYSTVLHDTLKNPHVTIHMLMLFLQRGINPNRRDSKDLPPHAYVMNSSLPDESKINVSKLLMLSCMIYSINGFEEDCDKVEAYEMNINANLNLEFYEEGIRDDLVDFRDKCIKEISRFYIDKLRIGCPIFDLIYRFCFTVERGDTTLLELKNHSRIKNLQNYVSLQTVEYFSLQYGDLDAHFSLLE